MTDDSGLAALALDVIRSHSVASLLCIIVSEPNPLTPTSIRPTLFALNISDPDGDAVE